MNNNKIVLGFDTSNYTTSISAVDNSGKVIANIKKLLPVKSGERGLRQSDAVFAHVKNLPELTDALSNVIHGCQVSAVGVSVKPRNIDGSYMPCFLVGKAVAEAVAATHNVPVYEFSHQDGHIMAALYASNNLTDLIKNDFIAFHISGGTTEALYVKPQAGSFDINIIYETADISAGQAIDRAGVMMGMGFPCGKELERCASAYSGKLPKPKISAKNGKCNFSGLENIAEKLYSETHDKAYVSAYVTSFIAHSLVQMTTDIREAYPDIPILYAGGVMSNKYLQQTLSQFDNTYFAAPEFSSDNAAGIALLAQRIHQ